MYHVSYKPANNERTEQGYCLYVLCKLKNAHSVHYCTLFLDEEQRNKSLHLFLYIILIIPISYCQKRKSQPVNLNEKNKRKKLLISVSFKYKVLMCTQIYIPHHLDV